MGSTDPFERDARRLIGIFARRLREAAGTAPEILAPDLVAIVRGHGWRPVEALKLPAPVTGSGTGRAEFLERRAAVESRPPCVCGAAVTDHQLDGARRTGCARTGCGRYAPIPVPTPERSS